MRRKKGGDGEKEKGAGRRRNEGVGKRNRSKGGINWESKMKIRI